MKKKSAKSTKKEKVSKKALNPRTLKKIAGGITEAGTMSSMKNFTKK